MGRLRNTWQTNEQHFSNFLGWCERLPAQLLESTPRLLYLCARALLFSGRLVEAETWLQRLGNFLPLPSAERNTRLLAHWQAMRGTLDVLQGNAASAQQHCRAALAQLGEGDWVAVLLCHTSLAHIAAVNGEPGRARQILQDGVELARRQQYLDCEVMLSIEKLRLMILQGGAERAQVLLRDEISRVEAGKRQHNPLLARLLFLQGELHLLNGELDASEEALLAGLAQADGCSAPFLLLGYLPLAEVAIRRGDCNLAQLHVHQAERRMQLGNIDKACYESAIALQRMRILAAEGRWESVLAKGQELEAQGATLRLSLPGMWSLQQRNQLLLAKAEHALGTLKQARRRLLTLLRQCQRYQFGLLVREVRRLMLELGFSDAPGESAVEDFTDAPAITGETGTDAMDSSPCDPEELTSREISVLRLLAEGMSNQQVSDFLFISTNTVKSHARSIHAKLGATRRTQAILIAKSMGVLS
ncbi:HTH-type transcriptional regulator MalT [compost metagenome]